MLKIRFFGVGDGDCILIQFPDGQLGLVDCCLCPGTRKPAPWDHIYDKSLNFFCLTHPHKDHYDGALTILKSTHITVKEFWYALSDIDDVIPLLNWAPVPDHDNAASIHVREEGAELIDIFSWLWDNPKRVRATELTDVHYREVGGVQLVIFGPDPTCWRVYKDRLARQRASGIPLRRSYENAISMAILMRYADHLVWLLADLVARPLSQLQARFESHMPQEIRSWGIRAGALKVPHHGAKNAWFPRFAEVYTSCQQDNRIIFSASGNAKHPHPTVWEYWLHTGKRMHGTWFNRPRTETRAWVRDAIRDIAPPSLANQTTDVIVTITGNGDMLTECVPPS